MLIINVVCFVKGGRNGMSSKLKAKEKIEIVFKGGHLMQPIKKHRPLDDEVETVHVSPSDEQLEIERGYQTEKRFEEVVTALVKSKKCRWLIGLRKASKAEDHLGAYDFVVTFSRNFLSKVPYEVAIDVKSSITGALNYRAEHGNNGVFPVVAGHDTATDKEIRERLHMIWLNTRYHPPHFEANFKRD